jgi:hypothetical protein
MILGKRLLGKGDVARGVAELETARKQAPESARTHWDLLLRIPAPAGVRTRTTKRKTLKNLTVSNPSRSPSSGEFPSEEF